MTPYYSYSKPTNIHYYLGVGMYIKATCKGVHIKLIWSDEIVYFIHYGKLVKKPKFLHNHFFRMITSVVIGQGRYTSEYFSKRVIKSLMEDNLYLSEMVMENVQAHSEGDYLITINHWYDKKSTHLSVPPMDIEELSSIILGSGKGL